ncbi:sugar ABC transporter permease [Streptomyces europaeiscabiei]|uniref:Sugar ABC transporter permease n=1 Tax=Streptomyces europaeiscabiei TaxID=146819 RepID=A0AAJ2PW27_9ACTN|nr:MULTISPECIES: sugar ABC transporter permease [Streptomyces]KFG01242.1 transporter [Streptomyces scabiei]MDX3134765.1 sugar ABC transporter permease [Streptomyces europaeiscabiei]
MIRSQRWKGAAFTVPFQLGFVFLYLLPIGYAVHESLFQEKQSGLGLGGATREFSGVENYRLGLTDPEFMGSILRVVLFACVQIPFMLLVSLVLALFLDALTSKAANRFRIVLLVPYMIPGVVAAIVWINLYSPEVGPLTPIGDLFGFDWNFFSPSMVWPSIGNLLTWHGIGYNMVIIYSALQGVPRELFEAARLDGASEARIALSVKIPFVRGALVLTGLLSIIQMLQIFNEPALFRNITPETVDDSFTPIMIIYNQAFNAGNYHYAAALSVLLALILGVASLLFYRLTSKEVD